MIRINLLPHREMRRERRKKDFIGMLALTAIAAAGLACPSRAMSSGRVAPASAA